MNKTHNHGKLWTDETFECNEESLLDKIKKRSSITAIIGTGILGLLHTASHLMPAIGVLGYTISEHSKLEDNHQVIDIFGYDINQVLSHPIMQVAYVGFVFLGFYYIYKDHKHHKHERIVKKQLQKTRKLLELTQKELESYKLRFMKEGNNKLL